MYVCNGGGGGENCRTDCWGCVGHQLAGWLGSGGAGWRRVSGFRSLCIRSCGGRSELGLVQFAHLHLSFVCESVCVCHYTYAYIMYAHTPPFGHKRSNTISDSEHRRRRRCWTLRVMASGEGGLGFRSKFRSCFHTAHACAPPRPPSSRRGPGPATIHAATPHCYYFKYLKTLGRSPDGSDTATTTTTAAAAAPSFRMHAPMRQPIYVYLQHFQRWIFHT